MNKIARHTAKKRSNRVSFKDGSENNRQYRCCVKRALKKDFHLLPSSNSLIGKTAPIKVLIAFAIRNSFLLGLLLFKVSIYYSGMV